MKYEEALKDFDSHKECPFCKENHQHKLADNKHFFVIPARAPYVPNHLLIVPKRHVVLLQELTGEELNIMHALVDIWAKKLHKFHKDVNLLLRDWLVGDWIWKSVNHLHFHIIPDCEIWAKNDNDSGNRNFLEEEEYIHLVTECKQKFL